MLSCPRSESLAPETPWMAIECSAAAGRPAGHCEGAIRRVAGGPRYAPAHGAPPRQQVRPVRAIDRRSRLRSRQTRRRTDRRPGACVERRSDGEGSPNDGGVRVREPLLRPAGPARAIDARSGHRSRRTRRRTDRRPRACVHRRWRRMARRWAEEPAGRGSPGEGLHPGSVARPSSIDPPVPPRRV